MPENPLIQYGRLLVKLRSAKGLTQEKAAFLMGVSKTSLRNWEKGRKIPTPRNLDILKEVYEIQGEDIHIIDGLVLMSRKDLIKTLSGVINDN